MRKNIIVGIDLAGVTTNPTGWALWENKAISTCHLYRDEEILNRSTDCGPHLIAIDAPLSLPTKGAMRKADREMHKRRYPVLPPLFPAMKKLTLRAMRMFQEFTRRGFNVIEVHPTSTRKALQMPLKDWPRIQEIFVEMGLGDKWKKRVLSRHETDAITCAITAHLHIQGKTELVGDMKEGYIVVPIRGYWRTLRL